MIFKIPSICETMITKNYTTRTQNFQSRHTPFSSSNQHEISKTLSWYKGRVQQLENEQQKLNKQLLECNSYLDFQSNNTRKLKATIRKLRKIYEDTDNQSQWVIIPKLLIHKAILVGLALFAFGLTLSLMGISHFTI